MIRQLWRWVLTGVMLAVAGSVGGAEPTLIRLGTGAPDGVYHPAGMAICNLVNRQRPEHGIGCVAQNSEGSIANLEALRAGDLDLAIVQSDWQYHAVQGSEVFTEAGPDEQLRALLSLHTEAFTVVARADAGITGFTDLKGERVNIGPVGSGQRATMELLLEFFGWSRDEFAALTEFEPGWQTVALCDDLVDAVVFIVGHPNRSVLETTATCESQLIAVHGPGVDKLIEARPYYVHTRILGGMYRGNPEPTETFGGKATLVARAELPEPIVRILMEAVFSHLDDLRQAHPALGRLDPEAMATQGLTAPLHPGAERYLRAAGLLGD